MDVARVAAESRDRVTAARQRLERRFGDVPVVDQDWPVSGAGYREYVARLEQGTLGGAGAWILDAAGRVLLVRETGQNAWSEPSGHQEPSESLCETARREVREETGLRIALTGVELFQHLHVTDDTPDRPPLHRVIVVFAATPVGGAVRPQPGEIAAVDWFETHPDAVRYEELRRLEIPYPIDGPRRCPNPRP